MAQLSTPWWIRAVAVGCVAFACGDRGAGPDASVTDARLPGGTVAMAWRFVDGSTTGVLCQELGAVAVKVVATPVNSVEGGQFSFDCDDYQGTSTVLPPATYDLSFQALGTGLRPLGDPVVETDVVVSAGQETGIGEITFDIVRSGSVTFTINTREEGGNCAAADPDLGAGLTSFELELTDNVGNCITGTTFQIANPAAPGTPDIYVSNCDGTPAVITADPDCITSTQTVTIPATPSGPRRLVIRGNQGDEACYSGVYSFSVLGGDTLLPFGERVILPVTPPGTCVFP